MQGAVVSLGAKGQPEGPRLAAGTEAGIAVVVADRLDLGEQGATRLHDRRQGPGHRLLLGNDHREIADDRGHPWRLAETG